MYIDQCTALDPCGLVHHLGVLTDNDSNYVSVQFLTSYYLTFDSPRWLEIAAGIGMEKNKIKF